LGIIRNADTRDIPLNINSFMVFGKFLAHGFVLKYLCSTKGMLVM